MPDPLQRLQAMQDTASVAAMLMLTFWALITLCSCAVAVTLAVLFYKGWRLVESLSKAVDKWTACQPPARPATAQPRSPEVPSEAARYSPK